MRKTHVTVLLAGLLFATTTWADVVPVIDAYQSSNASSSNAAPASTSTAIVSASENKSLPMDQRVTILERQVANLSQLLTQFTDLQQQVQDLRGKLETQKHDLQVMQDQMRSQYQDFDKRLTQKPAVAPVPAATASATKPKVAMVDDSNAATPDAEPAAATQDNGDAAYQAAYDLLTKKKYAQASPAFQSFIKKYPNNKNIADARYWLGMVYVVQGQPENAIPQFQAVARKNVQSKRVPDAIYQLAMAYYAKGDTKRAIAGLKLVQEKYPDSTAAKNAKNRLPQIQQSSSTTDIAATD